MRHPSLAAAIVISLGVECSLEAAAQTRAEAPEQPAQRPLLVGQVSSLAPDLLYKGWRARLLLNQDVHAKQDARKVGTVRDLIIDVDGRAAALIVEGGGAAKMPEFVQPCTKNSPRKSKFSYCAADRSQAGKPSLGCTTIAPWST